MTAKLSKFLELRMKYLHFFVFLYFDSDFSIIICYSDSIFCHKPRQSFSVRSKKVSNRRKGINER